MTWHIIFAKILFKGNVKRKEGYLYTKGEKYKRVNIIIIQCKLVEFFVMKDNIKNIQGV